MKYKYLVDVQHCHFSVASITKHGNAHRVSDTVESHFSFVIYWVEPIDFIIALEGLIESRCNSDTYFDYKEKVLPGCSWSDTIRMTMQCTTLTITRGNMKVLYCGSIDRVLELPKVLRKEMDKFNKLNKESVND